MMETEQIFKAIDIIIKVFFLMSGQGFSPHSLS